MASDLRLCDFVLPTSVVEIHPVSPRWLAICWQRHAPARDHRPVRTPSPPPVLRAARRLSVLALGSRSFSSLLPPRSLFLTTLPTWPARSPADLPLSLLVMTREWDQLGGPGLAPELVPRPTRPAAFLQVSRAAGRHQPAPRPSPATSPCTGWTPRGRVLRQRAPELPRQLHRAGELVVRSRCASSSTVSVMAVAA
jgi:hypothetical protein